MARVSGGKLVMVAQLAPPSSQTWMGWIRMKRSTVCEAAGIAASSAAAETVTNANPVCATIRSAVAA
jgi:hypothetical protein